MRCTPPMVILFTKVAPSPSGFLVKTLPCHAKAWTNRAIKRLQKVPGHTTASPAASPSGMGPAGLRINSSSSCDCDWALRSSKVIESGSEGFQVFHERMLVGIRQFGAEEVAPILDEV